MNTTYLQQAKKFLTDTNTKLKIEYKKTAPHFIGETESRDIYKVTLKNDKHSFSFNFGASINNTEKNIKPNEYDILGCLTKYDPKTFEDFCAEYGYDTDSRKAETIYFAVKCEYENIIKLFSPAQIKKLREIE